MNGMKALCLPGTAFLLLFSSSCATSPRGLVLEPVGPPPGALTETGPTGSLLVYSAFDSGADFNTTPYRQRYTDYRVYTSDGSDLLKKVRNDTGKLTEGPVRVELSPGTYRVVARANGYGTVTVPVLVKPSQTTLVHLEGSHWWSRSSTIFESNPVRLPGGQIVGWPAQPSAAE